jgi:hypothetical protein
VTIAQPGGTGAAQIECGPSRYSLNTQNAEDFPQLPVPLERSMSRLLGVGRRRAEPSLPTCRPYARSSSSSIWQCRCRVICRPSWVVITTAVLSSSGSWQQSQTVFGGVMALSSASGRSCCSTTRAGCPRPLQSRAASHVSEASPEALV